MGGFSLIVSLIIAVIGIYLSHHYYFNESRFIPPNQRRSIFEFNVAPIDDSKEFISLSKYQGKKAYLVVNVASQCGLTNRNYAELQELYEKYHAQGLEILAFPCDNFGHQEPGDNQAIIDFATNTKGATFPVLGKLECDNKENTHPLYQYLKKSIDGGLLGQGLKWNFSKFLCDEKGIPIKRYLPITPPLAIEKDISELIHSQ